MQSWRLSPEFFVLPNKMASEFRENDYLSSYNLSNVQNETVYPCHADRLCIPRCHVDKLYYNWIKLRRIKDQLLPIPATRSIWEEWNWADHPLQLCESFLEELVWAALLLHDGICDENSPVASKCLTLGGFLVDSKPPFQEQSCLSYAFSQMDSRALPDLSPTARPLSMRTTGFSRQSTVTSLSWQEELHWERSGNPTDHRRVGAK